MRKIISTIPLLLALWAFIPCSIQAADIIGTWVYEVSDTPPEYAQGEITISMDGEEYVAEIKTAGGMIKLDRVEVDGHILSFNVMIDGSDVSVKMTFEGDTMTGKAESYDGVFLMKGERKEN